MSHFELKFIVVVYDARWYLAVTKIDSCMWWVILFDDGISTRQSTCICFLNFGRSYKICSLLFCFKRDAAETYGDS